MPETTLTKTPDDRLGDLAGQINAEHRACVQGGIAMVEHAIKAGKLLVEAKAKCQHGTWLPYLEEEFEGTRRTAARYMQVFSTFPNGLPNETRVSHLSIRGVLAVLRKENKEAKKADKAARKQAVPDDLPDVTDRYQVYCDSCDSTLVADDSLDWIITDPPYGREDLPVFDELASFGARALKPGGSLICMTGQSYLPSVMASPANGLEYHWTLAYLTPGGQAVQVWQRKVNTFWKPLLWYVKGEHKGDWAGDVLKSDTNDNDKRFHEWGQSESGMADIIERFTFPGETICDPFCGGGTTGVVAVRMNRLFIGLDVEEKAINTTKRRLAEVSND